MTTCDDQTLATVEPESFNEHHTYLKLELE
jgi:hypothetical protein